MKFSSVEEDELAIFLLPMPVSLPGEEVGVPFRTISFSFEAICGEYLSRTKRLRKGRPSCPFCTQHKLAPWSKTDDIYIILYIYIYIYIYTYIPRYYGNHRLRTFITAKAPELLS